MLKIVIGQRGFVWVGNVTREGDMLLIKDARCIRRWGTENKPGLGYLANNGPTPTTVLEDPSDVEIHILAQVAAHICKKEAWSMYA